MSVIHLAGLGGHAFRSRAAPPIEMEFELNTVPGCSRGAVTFDEGVEIIMFDGSLLQPYLEGEQQCKQELVLFIQATA